MRALVASREPGPGVELAKVADPRPGPGEALVAVAAFSVNRGETFLLERPRPGWRPGKDIAGTVVAAAADGSGPAAGARVLAHLDCGGWAERVAMAAPRLCPLPEELSWEQAAALPLAGLTALRLTRAAGPLASRRVLLTGASGGVGHYFVELAAAQRARVTAVSRSAERGARLLELGAEAVVPTVAQAEGPFDVGLDSIGGESTGAVLSLLSEAGTLVWFGQASRDAPRLDFFDWRGGANAMIRKFHYATAAGDEAEDLAALVRLTAAGRLHPELGTVADWEEAPAAIAALLRREVRGNLVLTVTEPSTT